jgi:hypothetical protein
MAMRSGQDSIFRRRYDAYPLWLQHSMFPDEKCASYRLLPFRDKILAATALKEEGNKFMQSLSSYSDAIRLYEQALSVFEWLVNTDSDWKNKVK